MEKGSWKKPSSTKAHFQISSQLSSHTKIFCAGHGFVEDFQISVDDSHKSDCYSRIHENNSEVQCGNVFEKSNAGKAHENGYAKNRFPVKISNSTLRWKGEDYGLIRKTNRKLCGTLQ